MRFLVKISNPKVSGFCIGNMDGEGGMRLYDFLEQQCGHTVAEDLLIWFRKNTPAIMPTTPRLLYTHPRYKLYFIAD